jgi:antitoxin (DNA-binding transcriptional repressor) of toxin-antitoxin stability system
MRILDASKVRSSFAEIVESVREKPDVVVIIRYQRPIAALVPLHRLTESERKALVHLTETARSRKPRRPIGG